jgi:predicted Zn-dependent protease
MSRLEKLENMYQADPTDEFVCYGLAMEYRSLERHDEALKLFESLASNEPAHVPSFFMMGQMLAEIGKPDDAKSALQSGIVAGRQQGNDHAVGEMTEFLATLE